MKITSFNPSIVSTDPEKTIETFKSLGFEQKHHNSEASSKGNSATILESPEGYRIGIYSTEISPRSFAAIHMNVDNIDEAVAHFEKLGFVNRRPNGEGNRSARATMLFAPEGYAIEISEHIRKKPAEG